MELKEYLLPLKRWWWLLLLSMLVAAGSSYWATQQQLEQYSTSTTLIIGSAFENPNPLQSEISLGLTLAATYVDLANRPSVRADTMEALGLRQLPEILVTQPANGNVIDIVVIDTSPERAQAVATEISRQLILRSPTAEGNDPDREAFINEQLDDYEETIINIESQIQELNQELPQLVSAREIADLQGEIRTLESNLRELRSNYILLLQRTGEGATNVIRVLEPATLPRVPIDPQNEVTIIVSASIGFMLAALAAYLLEYLDDTVRTPMALTRLTKLPLLAGIAETKLQVDEKLVTIAQPRSPSSEAFRGLRTAIQFASVDETSQVLLVTSASPKAGKSTTSSNLAVVLAQAGQRVLLVDTDLRRPAIHTIFDLPNKRGLTNMLLEFREDDSETTTTNLVDKTVQETRVAGLQILTCGSLPPNPSELLGSKKMRELISVLKSRYDFVVLDSPPTLSVTDAVILSTLVNGTMLVARSGVTRKDLIRQSADRLRGVNARLIGCVLNSLETRDDYYGMHYYQDSYHENEDESDPASKKKGPSNRFLKRIVGRQKT